MVTAIGFSLINFYRGFLKNFDECLAASVLNAKKIEKIDQIKTTSSAHKKKYFSKNLRVHFFMTLKNIKFKKKIGFTLW